MNKQQLRISKADLKRCDQAIEAVEKMAGLKRCQKYESTRIYADHVAECLERLKLIYAAHVGTVINADTKIPAFDWRELIGEVNSLYAYGYPSPNVGEWRAIALKPIELAKSRMEWIYEQRSKK